MLFTWFKYFITHHFSEVGIEAKKFIDAGALVPDGVMVKLIADELQLLKDHSWLLDGGV